MRSRRARALESVLANAGGRISRTHDLDTFVEQLESAGHELPESLANVSWLSAWAVLTRYEEADAPLDRAAAVELADSATT